MTPTPTPTPTPTIAKKHVNFSREPLLDFSVYLGNKETEPDDPIMVFESKEMGTRHAPLTYQVFYDAIMEQFKERGWRAYQSAHAVTNKGAIYFGLAELGCESDTVVPIVAWRSSHNQRISATLYLGAGLPEQNILCITNEVKVATRQTTNLHARLPCMISKSLDDLAILEKEQQRAFARFKRTRLSSIEAEQAIIDMVRQDIISPSKAGLVIAEWDMPTRQFLRGSRSVWRLFHAVAESYKPVGDTDSISTLIDRTPYLMAYMKDMVMARTK